jgi:hypothetical protein
VSTSPSLGLLTDLRYCSVMRLLMFSLLFTFGIAPSSGAEWTSRTGPCFDWEGYWTVEQEQAGEWVGHIDFANIGGPCGPATNKTATFEVRAVIVGQEFFSRRHGALGTCLAHGRIRGDQVRGVELCQGVTSLYGFALKFSRQ